MTFTQGYGETPITDEEAEALLPGVREALGEPIRKADVYDLEQAIAEEVADLAFLAAQSGDVPEQYDWEIDKPQYIALLREFDVNRDAKPLAAFIPVRALGG